MQVLATTLLSVHNLLNTHFAGPLQLKEFNFSYLFLRQWCRDVASGIDRHPDRTEIYFRLRYRVIESSSLVPVLFREVFSHPYISFFHLLVNCFSVIIIIIYHNHQLLQTGFVPVILKRTLRDLYN